MHSHAYIASQTTHQAASKGAQRGEATGEVFCPRRASHIGEMRCGEYQERDGCQFGCPNAVKPIRIAELKLELRQYPLEGRHVQRAEYVSRPHYDHCIECGNEKSPNPSLRCVSCAGARFHARRG
jgi:hypothetical protein